MTENGSVTNKVEKGVGEITFMHPRSNSLPGELLRSIAQAVDQMAIDNNVRVVVLRSAGEKAFCAGASFDELLAVQTIEESKHFFSGFAILISAMRRCPKIILTRVQGKAVGGGVGVIAASDYCLASKEASIRLSEFALGFGPFVIGPVVKRKLGAAKFAEAALDADWRDALWAKQNGLYAKVYETVGELDEAVQKFATQLAASNPEACAQFKKIFWEEEDLSSAQSLEALLAQRVTITSTLALTKFVQEKVHAVNTK
jgi:methylglutaconyl-CoA hydratase